MSDNPHKAIQFLIDTAEPYSRAKASRIYLEGFLKSRKAQLMNREEITRMAQEAGFVGMDGEHGGLRRFAALVASAEREACAKIADTAEPYKSADLIRARG